MSNWERNHHKKSDNFSTFLEPLFDSSLLFTLIARLVSHSCAFNVPGREVEKQKVPNGHIGPPEPGLPAYLRRRWISCRLGAETRPTAPHH